MRPEGLRAEVEWGHEVTGLHQDPHGVTLQVGGQDLRAGWVVGCDGAHSRIRKAAAIGFPGVPLVEGFLLADVRAGLPLPREAVSVWLSGDRMIGAFPLPGADLWRLMTPATAAEDSEDVLASVRRALEEQTGIDAALIRHADWTSTFRIQRRLASTYRRGRVLLAGDAAHIHSPFGGQGMNTGLGDAENLAWKLALVSSGRAASPLLDTYERERRPIAREVLESTSAMTRIVVGGSAPARFLRDRLLLPLLDRPRVQRMVWEQASQLKITYRHGPLGMSRPRGLVSRAGTGAGDRVPDVPTRREDGSPSRLHRELGGTWALLQPCEPHPRLAAAVRAHLSAADVTLLTHEETTDDCLLVRPDGHLAWRGTRARDLDHALAAILHRGRVR
ncbi:FAD-dependent monooxygenase [Streptomyces sp. NPDC101132]|uniref:FAD-dependent monooxygenase n=1 Tax=Streptomyces sp. NPDC101132 TaxID=3366110 RepID=UPI003807CD04